MFPNRCNCFPLGKATCTANVYIIKMISAMWRNVSSHNSSHSVLPLAAHTVSNSTGNFAHWSFKRVLEFPWQTTIPPLFTARCSVGTLLNSGILCWGGQPRLQSFSGNSTQLRYRSRSSVAFCGSLVFFMLLPLLQVSMQSPHSVFNHQSSF